MEVEKYYIFQPAGSIMKAIVRPIKVVEDVAFVKSTGYDTNVLYSQTKEITKDKWYMFREITADEYMETLNEMLDNTYENEYKIVRGGRE